MTFVDDYGHLPGEIAPTLATARLGGFERVVAVFQPHRYTRTAALAADFATAFDDADVVVVTDVYSAGEPPIPGISGRLVADASAAARPGAEVHYEPGREGLRARRRRPARGRATSVSPSGPATSPRSRTSGARTWR